MTLSVRNNIEKLLHRADITINGTRPWDIRIHNDLFFDRILREGSLGLGESYMDRWWDVEKLDEFFYRILRADLHRRFESAVYHLWYEFKSLFRNPQNESKSFEVGERHYDVGNDLYEVMLDPRMIYTCGYWKPGNDLEQAQVNKLDHVCRILDLGPDQRILDIGCGWGGFAAYAAEQYECEVVGITVSVRQAELARVRCRGLPVEIRLQDYREVDEQFDHIVSLGMFEHVGQKNYRTYFQVADRCLADEGIFVLHTIGGNRSVTHTDPWIEKYIFPNSMIPSIRQIGLAIEDLFLMEDWSNRGPDYDKTLMAWHENVNRGWEQLMNTYSERFRRMWNYYLLSSAGSFRARKNNQWQIVLTKKGRTAPVTIPPL
ncbi:MAG: cyclopropane fatty acyl phospholipid synthase [Balneolaceae bacterium]|nr:cyclopropane fatty acyl phospholipid synthase [Balneolaceae bacterium]